MSLHFPQTRAVFVFILTVFNRYWFFLQNTVEYGEKSGANDADVFSAVYHKLVHSPALETILEQEHSYAIAVAEIIAERDKQVAQLTERYI